MGENKHITELDAFAKKYVKEIKKAQPSKAFTESLMHKIAMEPKTKVYTSEALISKKVWAILAVFFVTILCIPFQSSKVSDQKFWDFDFSFFSNFKLNNWLTTISISHTTFYVFLIFGALVAVQFFYLKRYLDSRLS